MLVTSLEGDPNSAISHDYLPGSVLRGGIIGLHLRESKQSELNLTDSAVQRRYFNGKTRFLNGYIGIDAHRSLPAPRSWEQDKHAQSKEEKAKLTDRALTPLSEIDVEGHVPQEAGKPKSLGGKFCTTNPHGEMVYLEPQHIINVHTERNREKGRSLGDGQGTIYRYDALAVGQMFEALILCEQDSDADYFMKLLKKYPETALGGARSAGYGRIGLDNIHVRDVHREVNGAITLDPSRLVITLLSDVILRDANGQYAPDAETLCQCVASRLSLSSHQSPTKVSLLPYLSENEALMADFLASQNLRLEQEHISQTYALSAILRLMCVQPQ